MIQISKDYLKRLYEIFGNWSVSSETKGNTPIDLYKSLYNKVQNPYRYVRDVIVEIGTYLPRFVLGMTNRIKIWMKYDDPDILDHELWHMEGKEEYETRALMDAGIRPDRSKWRIIKRFATA